MTKRREVQGSESRLLFEDAERLIVEGRCDEALQLVRGIEKRQIEIAARLRCDVLESKCLTKLGDFEEALRISRQVVEECDGTSGSAVIMVDALVSGAETLWRMGRLDESLDAIEKGEQMLHNLMSHTRVLHAVVC